MKALCADLLAEYTALAALVENLTPDQWVARTAFYSWTPFDEIAHLCFFEQAGLLAANDSAAFEQDTKNILVELAKGVQISDLARRRLGYLSGPELVAHWRKQFACLVEKLTVLDSKARLPWYGPSMSVRSFATARLMETWAHGQDIYDLLGLKRVGTGRLKHIAHLGVTTFGWTFSNRKLAIPELAPHVVLAAPNGSTWAWNEPSDTEYVRGSAEDFCLLVTQRRHLDDTDLEYGGSSTHAWLSIAQCFAGPPANGPASGQRG